MLSFTQLSLTPIRRHERSADEQEQPGDYGPYKLVLCRYDNGPEGPCCPGTQLFECKDDTQDEDPLEITHHIGNHEAMHGDKQVLHVKAGKCDCNKWQDFAKRFLVSDLKYDISVGRLPNKKWSTHLLPRASFTDGLLRAPLAKRELGLDDNVVLWLYPESPENTNDWDFAFDFQDEQAERLECWVDQGYKPMLMRVHSVREASDALDKFSSRSLKAVVLGGHGSGNRMQWSGIMANDLQVETDSNGKSSRFLDKLDTKLTIDAIVLMDACNNANRNAIEPAVSRSKMTLFEFVGTKLPGREVVASTMKHDPSTNIKRNPLDANSIRIGPLRTRPQCLNAMNMRFVNSKGKLKTLRRLPGFPACDKLTSQDFAYIKANPQVFKWTKVGVRFVSEMRKRFRWTEPDEVDEGQLVSHHWQVLLYNRLWRDLRQGGSWACPKGPCVERSQTIDGYCMTRCTTKTSEEACSPGAPEAPLHSSGASEDVEKEFSQEFKGRCQAGYSQRICDFKIKDP